MQFFDNRYIYGIPEQDIKNSYVSNSAGKGNYNENENKNKWKGTVAKTGSSPDYKVKNIYDMAGNVREWTMEACNTEKRIARGGDYGNDSGLRIPASNRNDFDVSYSVDWIGFRIALYL